MLITVDRESSNPVYQQIRDQVVALIQSGVLKPEDKLPGTRELAVQLEVSRKTVLQAYLELAADGWVETKPGSCTYVLDRDALISSPAAAPAPPGIELLAGPDSAEDAGAEDGAAGSAQMDWSAYNLEVKYIGMPSLKDHWEGEEEFISFSQAIPDVRLFPFERIKKVSSQMLWDPKSYFFDYGNPQGYMPLLEDIELRLAKDGVQFSGNRTDLVVCSGFQISLNLLLSLLVKPGELVVVEDPTFNPILNLLTARDIPHLGVPMEHDGMDVEYLERLLAREKPRLLITIPTLHNPTGVTMSRPKRERLLELARQYSLPVVEDHWSLLLGHDGKYEPSLKALDTDGHVIQIGSFSKAFLPGTRVAWVALPSALGLSFIKAKRALDRSDSFFLQTMVHEFIKKGYMDLHNRKVERIYRARRELMDEMMQVHFPSTVSWKKPTGGFCYWVALPTGMSSRRLVRGAAEHGVKYVPSNYFNVGGKDSKYFRLAFSTLTQPQIRQGIKRLGQMLDAALAQPEQAASGR
jgi:DNA-binding transcriptional MocR family regulator